MTPSFLNKSVMFGLALPILAISLALAGAFFALLQADGLMRYPGAQPLGSPHFSLDTLARGYVLQHAAYHSVEEIPSIMRWYMRVLEVRPDAIGDAMGSCQSLGRRDEQRPLHQTIRVILCLQPEGTLIILHRSWMVSW